MQIFIWSLSKCVCTLYIDDDADLEAELMALEGKSPKKGGKGKAGGGGKGALSAADVDSMLAGIGNIGEMGEEDDDEDMSDVDEEDLLGELQVTRSRFVSFPAIMSRIATAYCCNL